MSGCGLSDADERDLRRIGWPGGYVAADGTPGKTQAAAKPVAHPGGLSSGRGVQFPSVSTNLK